VTACQFSFRFFPAFPQSKFYNKLSTWNFDTKKKQQASLIALQPCRMETDTWTIFEKLNIGGVNWPSVTPA